MKKIIALSIALAPLSALAQNQISNVDNIFTRVASLGNSFITILISFAVIWIIFGVVRYLIAGGDGEARKKGGWTILYGVIGLFVILSVWGLVAILKNSFQTQNNVPTNEFPQIGIVH